MDILRFINSKDIRKHLKDIDYKFSTLEAAWIIYHSNRHTLYEKLDAFEELMKEYPDCEVKERVNTKAQDSLFEYLDEYIFAYKKLIDEFKSSGTYSVEVRYKTKDGFDSYDINQAFDNFSAALEQCKLEKGEDNDIYEFYIKKLSILNEASNEFVHPSKLIIRATDFEIMDACYGINESITNKAKADIAEYKLPPIDIFQEKKSDFYKTVAIRELIDSPSFKNQESILSVCLGKNADGDAVYLDLDKTPNLLIVGATGTGKSVCINSIVASILYKAKPDEVQFIMIDPKRWELSNYKNIPYLLKPIATHPIDASEALGWAVSEMEKRYRFFSYAGVSNIDEYNEFIKDIDDKKPMPKIVICIDELADLMICVPNEIEDSICRLAQKSCAAGIHLVVATQRPIPDIITDKIKANISSRIALRVSDQDDSRIILDLTGAEELKGHGDMLYLPMDSRVPQHIHGCYISDTEIVKLCDYVSNNHKHQDSVNYEILNDVFCGLWFDFPTPFKAGDIVWDVTRKINPCVLYSIGFEDMGEKFFESRKYNGDVSDMNYGAYYALDDGSVFSDNSWNYMDLEYYTDELENEEKVLKPISYLLKDKIDIGLCVNVINVLGKRLVVEKSIPLGYTEDILAELGISNKEG